MTTTLTDFAREPESHLQALLRATAEGYRLDKAADPNEGYREDLTPAEAADVAAVDPGLISLHRWTCTGCGDHTAAPAWHDGQPFCEGCEAAPAEGAAEARKALRRELLAALQRECGTDGSGDYGVIVDEVLARDPAVAAEDVITIVREAREEWATEAGQ